MIFKGTPKITTIVLHHTAVSRNTQQVQSGAVNNYHKEKWDSLSELGFYGGYNFFCEATGERIQFRKVGEETIANVGMNCDIPERCIAISYCMAGDFRVEKPTELQVADFRAFINELRKVYPDIVIKQHKDVQDGRTCAELTDAELQSIIMEKDSKDVIIKKLTNQNLQLLQMVRTLLTLINK